MSRRNALRCKWCNSKVADLDSDGHPRALFGDADGLEGVAQDGDGLVPVFAARCRGRNGCGRVNRWILDLDARALKRVT